MSRKVLARPKPRWPYTKFCPKCKGDRQVTRWWGGRPIECPACGGDGIVWTAIYTAYSRWRHGPELEE